jgi:hypothetical protein
MSLVAPTLQAFFTDRLTRQLQARGCQIFRVRTLGKCNSYSGCVKV